MIAALYVRVSTAEQDLHGYSLEAQEKLLRDYAAQNGMTIFGLYADRGKSANKALSKRTELLRMVDDAEHGRFDIILFKDITRWSRNSAQYYMIQDRLDKANVSWIAVEQPYLETRTPTGRFQVTVMLGTAQLESENTSQRIRFVQDRMVQLGGVLSGKVPFGYKIAEVDGMKRLVKDESKKPIVDDLFQYYIKHRNQGKTLRYIKDKYGLSIWQSRIHDILHDPIYKGSYRDNPNYCEPYLTESEWNLIQSLGQIRRAAKHNGSFLFRSLLHCPVCGHVMTANYNAGFVYYRCSYHSNQRICPHKWQYRQDRIERAMLDNIALLLDNTAVFEAPFASQDRLPDNDMKTALNRQYRRLANLKELYIDGDIDKATYTAKRDAIRAEISRIESSHSEQAAPVTHLLNTPWRDLYESKTDIEKAEWWRFVLARIDVVDNEFIPTFRSYV